MSDIKINSISKNYITGDSTVRALNDFTLDISWGDFIGISGESGSGKSTLLLITGAMLMPDSGDYIVDDINVFSLSQEKRSDFRREYLGFIFQSFHLMPYLTAVENVMLPLAVKNISKKDKYKMATEALGSVGLSDKWKRLPDELSGGEKERVAIARAVVNNPRILLADEPTGNLDSKTSGEIMSLFKQLNSDGMTIIMVSHSAECIRASDRLIKLSDGKLVYSQ